MPQMSSESGEQDSSSNDIEVIMDTRTATQEIVTPTFSRTASLVNRLVSQCREMPATSTSKVPIYPTEDFVQFSESRTGDFRLAYGRADDYTCPSTYTEMLNIATRIRDQRLQQAPYVHFTTSDCAGSYAMSPNYDGEEDDDDDPVPRFVRNRTPNGNLFESDPEEDDDEIYG